MTEQELRKKIVEIVIDSIWKDAEADYDSTDESAARTIADALIAAGIGDVSEYERLKIELRSKVDYIHELWDVKEDYKHRAEVAEKALDKATELAYTYCTQDDTFSCSSCPFNSIFDRCKERGLYEDCSKWWKEELLQQAEKELAEERKEL